MSIDAIEAKKYTVQVDLGASKKTEITEIYIPQIDVCLNSIGEIFERSSPRSEENTTITLNYQEVVTIQQFIKLKKSRNEIQEKLFGGINIGKV